MTVKFRESFRLLVEVAIANELPLDADTTFLRDGSGRLLVARPTIPGREKLTRDVRDSLGGYASTVPVIDGVAAARLSTDRATQVSVITNTGETIWVRYIDRRFVGADWMQPPAPESSGPKRIVFGSLKGGVGRSTALAVLAADLARSEKKVLCIDLDLEAPGIGSMLLPASEDQAVDRRPKFGAVDYLLEKGMNGIGDDELYDFIGVSSFHDGAIDVVPAVGRETDHDPKSMIAKLSRALLEDRNGANSISLTEQVREMVTRFSSRAQYDVILVDARAGMAEITAAPLLGLGAEVFLFGVNQPQTFQGYAYILAHLASVGSGAEDASWRERITFVQAKAPSASAKRQSFRESLYELCASYLYDQERLDSDGKVVMGAFTPSITDDGPGVPHDATFIQYHPEYDAFDPVGDSTQLDAEVYSGPFANFLHRAWSVVDSGGPVT